MDMSFAHTSLGLRGDPVGAVIVVQEIFGLNGRIRNIADKFAKEGFLAIARELFDKIECGVELEDMGDDLNRGFELMRKLLPDHGLEDIVAVSKLAGAFADELAIVGFCYGGLMS